MSAAAPEFLLILTADEPNENNASYVVGTWAAPAGVVPRDIWKQIRKEKRWRNPDSFRKRFVEALEAAGARRLPTHELHIDSGTYTEGE